MSSEDHPDWWKNVGGSNARDSLLERRSLVYNDNGVEAPDLPPNIHTCEDGVGKFFSRGMRGKIEIIQIYSRRPVAEFIELIISPHPDLGPFYTIRVMPGPTWAWYGTDFERFWDYDSLFIWVHDCAGAAQWGYDTAEPYDGHEYDEPNDRWDAIDTRPYIRALYSSQTPGDVPISGIINNIPLPNVSSTKEYGWEAPIIQGLWTTLIGPVYGAGFVECMILDVVAAAGSEQTMFQVLCDRQFSFQAELTLLNLAGIAPTTPRVTLTNYLVDGRCSLVLTHKFEFKREFHVRAFNGVGPQNITFWALPTLLS